MDYGPHWPPVPKPARTHLTLWQECVAAIVTFALIWALGVNILQITQFIHHLSSPTSR